MLHKNYSKTINNKTKQIVHTPTSTLLGPYLLSSANSYSPTPPILICLHLSVMGHPVPYTLPIIGDSKSEKKNI